MQSVPRIRFLPPLLMVGLLGIVGIAIGAKVLAGRYLNQANSYAVAPDRIGTNAPFITSPDAVVDQMVKMAELKPGDVAYDLGCGDGRIIITAALKTGCRGVGFEIDPERVAEARKNVKLHGVGHLVEIHQQDIFTADLSEADAVFLFLLPWMNQKLIPQFQKLRPGARIISHEFTLGDAEELKPEKTVSMEVPGQSAEHLIHRWVTPLRVPAK
jgi:precorrin-6B methylase 2